MSKNLDFYRPMDNMFAFQYILNDSTHQCSDLQQFAISAKNHVSGVKIIRR